MFGTLSPLSPLPLMIGPLGMQEMLIILVVALIVFGPRKLPQIGKTLGKSIAEFRRTSTELRSTLEREVQMEEFRAARTEVTELRRDVTNLGRGLDPDGGSGPAGPGVSGSSGATASGAEPEPVAEPGHSAPGATTDGPPAGAAAEKTTGADEESDAPGDSESESTEDSGK